MSRLAMITFLSGPDAVDPGYGGGLHPSHDLPGAPVYPSHGLPGGGHISTLPVFPFDPTEKPDNSLPTPPADTKPIVPGRKFIVKWLACYGLILVPDNSLPETAEPK